jgi:sirohydrochlorin ferrochelatase
MLGERLADPTSFRNLSEAHGARLAAFTPSMSISLSKNVDRVLSVRGSNLIEAGVDLYTVSRRLGHATTAVTELHYVDPSEKADEAAADVLGDLRRLAPGAKR